MPYNNKYQTLDNIIFNNGSFDDFNKTLEEVLNLEEFNSEGEKKKKYSLYLWIFISHTSESVKTDIKSIFLKNYWKYVNDSLSKNKRVQAKDKYLQENEIINEPKIIKEEFENVISNFQNLKDYKLFESDIKKIIFFPNNNLIFKTFIKSELIDKYKIQELFGELKIYMNSEGMPKSNSFKTTKRKLEAYIKEAENYASTYTKCLIIGFGNKLLELITKDFSESYENKPASIEFRNTDKKYPFHKRGAKIAVELKIDNIGAGPAYDFKLTILNYSNTIEMTRTDFFYGSIEKGDITIELNLINSIISKQVYIEGKYTWKDIGDNSFEEGFKIDLHAQKSDVDWAQLVKNKPYNLEPITSQEKLIGRIDILNDLTSNIHSNNIESYILYGQKRTGKTSIVKTFETIINNLNEKNIKVSYIDGGDIAYPDVKDVISQFGVKMCETIKNIDRKFNHLEVPEFNGALAPIDSFLTKVIDIMEDLKMVFIIDEFDEFVLDLYKGKYADSFFQTIRSISSKENFGFILVGGEKMEVIKKEQGYRLNKFKIESVSYFDKENNYTNFIKLVRKPISNLLEISDESIDLLYQYTSGNPYFSKFICAKLSYIMYKLKDSSITIKEVEEAYQYALATVESNSFHHFWMDGVLSKESLKETTLEDRRKLLLSFIEALRQGNTTKENIILISEELYYMKKIISEHVLRDFLRRNVFVKNENDIRCKVLFFENWLMNKGVNEIIAGSTSIDSILRDRLINEEDFVQSREVSELIKNWGTYKGDKVNEDSVRSWLSQFGDNTNQRLAFNILKGMKFYNYSFIRESLESAFISIKKEIKSRIKKGDKTRKDILVSYLDEPAKSGAHYAKLFADENKVFHKNVIIKENIFSSLENSSEEIGALIFIDDFIGTGKSISSFTNELFENDDLVELINKNNIIVFVIAISGYASAKDSLLKKNKKIKNFNIKICDVLDESNRAFSENNELFKSSGERLKAHDLAFKFGERLEKNHPLGYSGSQSLVVFERSCPNNTLPIIWKEKNQWIPLFKRI